MTEAAATAPEELSPEYYQDPHAYFARMRAEGPVTQVRLPDGGRFWLITRYADVRAALADPRLHKDWATKLTGPDWRPDPVTGFLAVHLLNSDPPSHTRLRRLVTKAFTARRVAGLRRRRRRRRLARRARTARDAVPAAARRARDDDEPDRVLDPRAAPVAG